MADGPNVYNDGDVRENSWLGNRKFDGKTNDEQNTNCYTLGVRGFPPAT